MLKRNWCECEISCMYIYNEYQGSINKTVERMNVIGDSIYAVVFLFSRSSLSRARERLTSQVLRRIDTDIGLLSPPQHVVIHSQQLRARAPSYFISYSLYTYSHFYQCVCTTI